MLGSSLASDGFSFRLSHRVPGVAAQQRRALMPLPIGQHNPIHVI